MEQVDGHPAGYAAPMAGDSLASGASASSASELFNGGLSGDERGYMWLVAAWTGFWFVSHFWLWPVWNPRRFCSLACRPTPIDRYRRRLCRSQVYCLIAAVGGIHLLYYKCSWTAADLLYGYSQEHELLFAMAAAHWIVSVWEDLSNWKFLSSGLTPEDLFKQNSKGQRSDPAVFLSKAYLVHHLVAGLGFLAVLHLRSCVGVCTFGLVFELPVLLMNHREFIIYAERPPLWWRDLDSVKYFWRILLVVFNIARYGPSFVYVYSIMYWWQDLYALDGREVMVYHLMAIFFTGLNISLAVSILKAWQQRDLIKCMSAGGDEVSAKTQRFEYHDWADKDDEERKHVDPSVPEVKVISRAKLESKNGAGEDGEIWVEIDGTAFNVTKFMKKHPGGEAVFRRHAGKDASAGFHRVRHSVNAKRIMQTMALGPIERQPTRYKIFEHVQDLKDVFNNAQLKMTIFVSLCCMLRYTGFLDVDLLRHDDSFAALCVPGCFMSMLGGCLFLILRMCMGQCTNPFDAGAHMIAVAVTGFSVALVLARRALPAEVPESFPTAFEIAGGLLFLIEDVLELCSSGRDFSATSFIALALAMGSWYSRGLFQLYEAAYEHVVAGVLMAVCMASVVRTSRADADKYSIAATVLNGLSVLGPWNLIFLVWVTSNDERADMVFRNVRQQSWNTYFVYSLTSLLQVGLFVMVLNNAFGTSKAFTVRMYALILVLIVWTVNGLHDWRWMFVLGFIGHISCLNGRLREQLQHADWETEWKQMHRIGTQALWDQVRVSVATGFWTILTPLVEGIVKAILPEELTVYACGLPIFDLGDDVDMGICAYYAPPRRKGKPPKSAEDGVPNGENGDARTAQDKPEHFVCNVGHIDTMHPSGLNDLQRRMHAMRDCWTEYQTDNAKGLIASVAAVFPFIQGSTAAKELNLSVWASEEDAQNWHETSKAHRAVMRQHGGGQLRSFGNFTASMTPLDQVRYQDRCQRCARLVESARVGEPPPLRCEACGAKTFDYPLF